MLQYSQTSHFTREHDSLSQNAIIDVPDITTNGWINYDEIKWVESVFPQDIENLVVDYSSDIDDVFGSDVETDEEY